ncbi:MAG TPA: response regulator [Symbiobacteriaceae bacterium]|nr:response regulator [Symbiobacteriaceae bacterium]
MCTLLIVEDEATFRDGIVSMIDWAAHGIEVCGAVANGQEAWALIEQQAPDLLLTDIRMPVMDGLELLERVTAARLPTQVILLSGFGEFEYAKRAVKLGAVDYLLKPCRPEDLLAVVEAARRSQFSRQESWRLAKEQLLCQWMQSNGAPPPDRAAALLAEYRMAIADGPAHVGVLRRQAGAGAGAGSAANGADVSQDGALRNLIRAALGPLYGQRLEIFPLGDEWLWAGNVAEGADRGALRATLQQLREQILTETGLPAVVGVGGVCRKLAELHKSYAEARRALGARDDLPQQSIFLYEELAAGRPQAESALVDPEMTAREAKILQQMQAGRYAQAIDAAELWLEHLRRHPEYSRRQVRARAIGLLMGLQRTTQVQSIPAIRWKEELIEGISLLPTVESVDELATLMTKYLQHLVGILSSHRPVHRTVEAAVKLVAVSYQHSNLTLESVAREVFVSTSYLSTLFKQEMGIGFLDYLHQYRIDRAKELLAREPLKVFAVAKLVGYQDERHFSATFKKWTGISPSRFQRTALS